MSRSTTKQYNIELDYFIVNSINKKNIGYQDLMRLIKATHNPNISDDTLSRHLKHLISRERIKKDTRYAPFYLTENCKQQLKLGSLYLVAPTLNESSSSTKVAKKRISTYILILLFKLGITYEFERIEELENFLFTLGLSIKSFAIKIATEPIEVWESHDRKISINKRYLPSPHRKKNAISFTCNIKGVKYPIDRLRSDPFRRMNITQDEILDALSTLSNEGVLQEPIVDSSNKVYLAADLRLYELLDEYAYSYIVSRSILKNLWNLRRPILEEIQWLQTIEGESTVAKFTSKSQIYRNRVHRSYYERKKLIKDLIKKTSKTEIKEVSFKESLEKEYQEIISNSPYQFIIYEIEKFAFPDWLQRIRMTLRN